MDLEGKINDLFESQLRNWELASVNYHDLDKVKVRHIPFEGYEIRMQFNPKRIVSSTAKVDAGSIEARPCFLCSVNRPVQQQGIGFMDEYIILINPFPVFPKHLTVPSLQHKAQLIRDNFRSMLHLARALPAFVVFYNGPQCGASAPDHFHFQAGLKGLMPIEHEYLNSGRCILLQNRNGIMLYHWQGYLRNLVTIRGNDLAALAFFFDELYVQLHTFQPETVEPMLNILVWYDNNEWIVHVIPRKMHRPAQYFEKGNRQILISPASVDLGGAFIFPREEDFDKIGREDIADICRQVGMEDKSYAILLDSLITANRNRPIE